MRPRPYALRFEYCEQAKPRVEPEEVTVEMWPCSIREGSRIRIGGHEGVYRITRIRDGEVTAVKEKSR